MPIDRNDPDLVIELQCLSEDMPIEGNASAIDDITDASTEKWIRDQLAAGNAWAWCTAHVRVTYREAITAEAYLGCCSYESEADFRKPQFTVTDIDGKVSEGSYFDDMVTECIAEIERKLVVLSAPKKGG